MRADGNDMRHGGTYVKIDRPKELVFTWGSPFSAEGSTVSLSFDAVDGGTFVTLHHLRFASEESRDNHEKGWTAILGSLAARAVSPLLSPEWRAARLELLAAEKVHMADGDRLAAARRALPPVPVAADYAFEGPDGPETLADLFGRHRQLAIYHFMFGPDWAEGCPSCSFWADNLDGIRPHLAARDVSLVMVARAPYAVLEAYNKRLGWSHRWASASAAFSTDLGVLFEEGSQQEYNFRPGGFHGSEAPGLSTYFRDEDGRIFLHYATYARGLEAVNGAYKLLDLTPKGRDEAGLGFSMAWLRRRDQYTDGVA